MQGSGVQRPHAGVLVTRGGGGLSPCPRLSCLSELARCRYSRYSRAAADTHTAAALPTSYSYSRPGQLQDPGHRLLQTPSAGDLQGVGGQHRVQDGAGAVRQYEAGVDSVDSVDSVPTADTSASLPKTTRGWVLGSGRGQGGGRPSQDISPAPHCACATHQTLHHCTPARLPHTLQCNRVMCLGLEEISVGVMCLGVTL